MALTDNEREFLARAALVCATDHQQWPHQDAVAEAMEFECNRLLKKMKEPAPASERLTSFMADPVAR